MREGVELAEIRAMLAKRPPTAGSFQERRARWQAQFTSICPPLPNAVIEPLERGEWVSLPDAGQKYVIFYVHGGGFTAGSAAAYRGLSSRFSAACNCRVLAIDYRLAPEDPFPAALDDCHAAYRWLASQVKTIVCLGDSAGGNLVAALLVKLRDGGEPLPAAAVFISGVFDLALSGESVTTRSSRDPMILPESLRLCSRAYLGEAEARTPLASPLYAELAGLPPLLVQVGSEEMLRDDSLRFARKAAAAGVEVSFEEWRDMIHVWHLFADRLAQGRAAIARVAEFVRARA